MVHGGDGGERGFDRHHVVLLMWLFVVVVWLNTPYYFLPVTFFGWFDSCIIQSSTSSFVTCLMHRCHLVIYVLQCCYYIIHPTTYDCLLFPHSSLLFFFLYSSFRCLLSDANSCFIIACLIPPRPHHFLINRLTIFLLYPDLLRPLLSAAELTTLPLMAAVIWLRRPQTRQSATTPSLPCIGGVVADCGGVCCCLSRASS